MKRVLLLTSLAAALVAPAGAGEVEIVLRGEVTINLSSPQPPEGSAMAIRLRVVTPGTTVIPGEQTEYQVVPESRSIHLSGIGSFLVQGPTTLTVYNHPATDYVGFTRDDNTPTLEMSGSASLSPSTWSTPDVEQLAGTYTDAGGVIGSGGLVGNGVYIEYVLRRLEIQGPSAGVAFCESSELNSTGYPTYLAGTFNSSGGGLHLEAQDGPSGQFGLIVVGPDQNDPCVPLGSGRLCLTPTGGLGLGRYAAGPLSSLGQFDPNGRFVNQSGTSSVGPGFDVPHVLPIPGLPTIQSGQTWHFQLWHRDSGGTSNLSNGLSVTF